MSISTRRLPRKPAPPMTATTFAAEATERCDADGEAGGNVIGRSDSSELNLQKLDAPVFAVLLLYAATHGFALLPIAPTLVSGTRACENCGWRCKALRYFTSTILIADNAKVRPGQACARWPYVETRYRRSSFHTLGSGSTPSYLEGLNSSSLRSA